MAQSSSFSDWTRHTATLGRLAAMALLSAGCGGEDPTSTPDTQTKATPAPAPAVRPNFVFVIVDDLDQASISLMPRINALLVQRGVAFTNSFACNPVSAPSRATLLTGLHAHNHGVNVNTNAYQVFSRNNGQSNLATWLHAAGYRTGMVGKHVNKYDGWDHDPGWDEWNGLLTDVDKETYFNYSIKETDGRITKYGSEAKDYITDVLTERALSFIKGSSSGDSRPFFLWVGYNAPHEPADNADRYIHEFPGKKAPRTPSFNETDISDKPTHYQSFPLLTDELINDIDAYYRARLRCMRVVGAGIERIVQLLETTGRISSTYIILTSDNGYLQGHHRYFWGKDAPFEPSIRVPLIYRGPGVPEGRTVGSLVANVDFAPTITALAGVTPPHELDGRSLAPLLTGATPAGWRTQILIEHVSPGPTHLPTYWGLRTSSEKFVRWISTEVELYDLMTDSDECENRRYKVTRDVLAKWEDRVSAVRNCRGAACP